MNQADKAAFEMWKISTPELKFRFEHGSLLMKNTASEAYQAALAHRDAQPLPRLTDEEIREIVKEASLGAATRRDGSTSTRIVNDMIAALEAKMKGTS